LTNAPSAADGLTWNSAASVTAASLGVRGLLVARSVASDAVNASTDAPLVSHFG
jgi:hypothetical protein